MTKKTKSSRSRFSSIETQRRSAKAMSAYASRRDFLSASGFSFLGMASSRARSSEGNELPPIITEKEFNEWKRLKALDLNSPEVKAKQKLMPRGKIGGLEVSRLTCGSNLISMNLHSRDLRYVYDLASHYNTEERIFMTLKKLEELGVNTINLKVQCFKRFNLKRYWDEWGGRMQWYADVITTDINKFEKLLVEHLELGAQAAYVWGGATDMWYFQGKQKNIIKAFEIIKKYGIPAGIGAHLLQPLEFCEKEGLKPDFYFKTLHPDDYWSAHPKANRRPLEMYRSWSRDHAFFHDNLWCQDPQRTIEFMQQVKVPWIAFKVLAAGAVPPEKGIRFAFENGSDFICLGMFDFQVEENVKLVRAAVKKASARARPWCA